MSEYKPYPIAPLEHLVEVLDHLRAPVNSEDRSLRPGAVPYFGATGLQGWIDKALTNEPLILLAEDGGNFDAYADRPIAYRIDGPAWVNNHAHIIRAKPGVSQSFVFWSIAHKDIRRFIAGGTRTKLTQSEMRRIEVPLPDPTEQIQIAAVLDTLDTTIRQTEAIIAKLKQVKQGLLHDLLTRGIDANGELRPPQSEAPHLYKASPLGWIPVEWSISSIDSACADVVDCPHSTPAFADAGALVARTMHIKDGRFLETIASRVSEAEYAKRIQRLEPEPGDVVFTREAPVGEAFVIPDGMRICLGQRVMLLRPSPGKLLGSFLTAQIYSGVVADRISALTAGTTNPHLNVSDVRQFILPLPPFREQVEIDARLNGLESRIRAEASQLEKWAVLKSGLMDDLLTGRVRVTPLLAQAPATQP
jgi:type I restriction enzyme S subunit